MYSNISMSMSCSGPNCLPWNIISYFHLQVFVNSTLIRLYLINKHEINCQWFINFSWHQTELNQNKHHISHCSLFFKCFCLSETVVSVVLWVLWICWWWPCSSSGPWWLYPGADTHTHTYSQWYGGTSAPYHSTITNHHKCNCCSQDYFNCTLNTTITHRHQTRIRHYWHGSRICYNVISLCNITGNNGIYSASVTIKISLIETHV